MSECWVGWGEGKWTFSTTLSHGSDLILPYSRDSNVFHPSFSLPSTLGAPGPLRGLETSSAPSICFIFLHVGSILLFSHTGCCAQWQTISLFSDKVLCGAIAHGFQDCLWGGRLNGFVFFKSFKTGSPWPAFYINGTLFGGGMRVGFILRPEKPLCLKTRKPEHLGKARISPFPLRRKRSVFGYYVALLHKLHSAASQQRQGWK